MAEHRRPKSTHAYEKYGLLLILAAAFLLRATGINFGLPYLYHQDEPIVVNHALAYGAGDFNPHFFKLPPLLSYLLFIVYGAAYLTMAVFHGYSKNDLLIHFFRDPS